MPKLPMVSGVEAGRALKRLGFQFVRQNGSHAIFRKETSEGARGCVVPMHREISRGTLRGVLDQAGVSAEEFMANL